MTDDLQEITAALAGAQRVVEVELVQRLWSGYGQLLRCRLEGGPRASVIVKQVQLPGRASHPRGWSSDLGHQRKLRSYEVEAHFYERYASRADPTCRLPTCLGVRRLEGQVVLVLEDLDHAGYAARRATVSAAELRACLSWLAHFHATFLGVSPAGLWPIGTYWHLATRPEELAALPDGALKRAAAVLDRRLNQSRFQTLVHGDAKLENFCFAADGSEVAAVDFQYVGGGCGMKDVAYFISSCLNEAESERQERALLADYFAQLEVALHARGTIVDFPALEQEWRALYPVAWTDFYRFLKGWSPGHHKLHRYSERLAAEVLKAL